MRPGHGLGFVLCATLRALALTVEWLKGHETCQKNQSINCHRFSLRRGGKGPEAGPTDSVSPGNNSTHSTALHPGLPGSAGTRKVKPIWILLKQETVGGSGISWAICKSVPRPRHVPTSAPHHSNFLRAGCPSCHPTNSVKALKAPDGIMAIKWK